MRILPLPPVRVDGSPRRTDTASASSPESWGRWRHAAASDCGLTRFDPTLTRTPRLVDPSDSKLGCETILSGFAVRENVKTVPPPPWGR